jgi:hypothetical protein
MNLHFFLKLKINNISTNLYLYIFLVCLYCTPISKVDSSKGEGEKCLPIVELFIKSVVNQNDSLAFNLLDCDLQKQLTYISFCQRTDSIRIVLGNKRIGKPALGFRYGKTIEQGTHLFRSKIYESTHSCDALATLYFQVEIKSKQCLINAFDIRCLYRQR